MEEYKRLTSEIAKVLPNAVKFVDANGTAHLKNADAIEKEVKRTRELAKAQASIDMQKQIEQVEKLGESYEKMRKEASKHQSVIDRYNEQNTVDVQSNNQKNQTS